MFRAVRDSLLSVVYPQNCKLCGSSVESSDDGIVCSDCWATANFFTGSEILCFRCGKFLSESGGPTETYCRQCDDQCFDRAFALGKYAGPLAASIIHLKSVPVIAPRLARAIERTASALPFPLKDLLVVPVPLSKRRLLERGFNQASVISRVVCGALQAEVDEHSLLRSSDTRMHRIAMDKKARDASVKNAFTVARPKLISGREIILVDDVFTSGSTASACAQALKESGATSVNVMTLARAV